VYVFVVCSFSLFHGEFSFVLVPDARESLDDRHAAQSATQGLDMSMMLERESQDDRHAAQSATQGLDMSMMLERESQDDRHAAQSATQGLDMSMMLEKDGELDQVAESATPLRKDHVGNVLAHAVASNTEAAHGVDQRAEREEPAKVPVVKTLLTPATLHEQEVCACICVCVCV
jgi:hypothetical protein